MPRRRGTGNAASEGGSSPAEHPTARDRSRIIGAVGEDGGRASFGVRARAAASPYPHAVDGGRPSRFTRGDSPDARRAASAFRLPSMPTGGVAPRGQLRDERPPTRRAGRRRFEPFADRRAQSPAAGCAFDEFAARRRRSAREAGQQRCAFARIEIGDQRGNTASPRRHERHRLGARANSACPGSMPAARASHGAAGPPHCLAIPRLPQALPTAPPGFATGGRGRRQQARQRRRVGRRERARPGVEQVRQTSVSCMLARAERGPGRHVAQ